ncbi:DUF1127 domain-containing protein [Chelativorans salis]|uniref:DUF1127 domain-containing protein n=1 Tax=Chelativorans salis TaxID=2978478 RepID=A0ABT2LSN7_9HYPH|nr:DUF1127 domain-containing protein [Chelativorans sp. EGI FJ00035]MCT7376857.1 DUF1127 domain-containing protein [Chelativorans sp. EGI FJ00035]
MAHIPLNSPSSTVFGIKDPSQRTLAALRLLADLLALPNRWRQRALERRHLCDLSDRLLADIGLTRADVDRKASKPFWQPVDPSQGDSPLSQSSK